MEKERYNVLFICTGNSARSIMAEAIMNNLGKEQFKAWSAGSDARGEIHPITLEVLSDQDYDVGNLRSKSWSEFVGSDAPKMDFIITVCDQGAGEACPAWPGQPITAHWGLVDPAKVEGDHEKRRDAFSRVQFQIANRIRLFMSLPIEKIDRMSLQKKLTELGQHNNTEAGDAVADS